MYPTSVVIHIPSHAYTNTCIATDDGHIEHTQLDFFTIINCILHVLILILNMYLSYNASLIQAISNVFTPGNIYRKTNILEFLIKLFVHVKRHFVLISGASTLLKLINFCLLSLL